MRLALKRTTPRRCSSKQGSFPGGWYARRKVKDWVEVVKADRIPALFDELIRSNTGNLDWSRPTVEFYHSQDELFLMAPAKGPPPSRVD